MAGWALLHVWNEWSIQVLILLSFTLQVFILLFARMRRNSRAWRILLWLAYLLADTTALYTLGHISNSKLPELRPAAFWAQFLVLHLGGQDTMTAYALEDNQLWLRHLLTLVLQALGAAYIFYRHIGDGGVLLVIAAFLIYLVGFMKYGERVWTLRSSSLDGITIFLESVGFYQSSEDLDDNSVADPEVVLQDAHNLLGICMGQFVDYKVWPSGYQMKVIIKYCTGTDRGNLFELTGMQLSLMHDMLYTKAVVIHTWCGCCNRAVSLVATVTALLLFRFKSGKLDGYTRADVAFTYTLLGGAILLEMTSILRAIGSSWTCAIFEDILRNPGAPVFARHIRRLDGLHSAVMFFRRLFKSAERGRRWSGSVGQHNFLDMFSMAVNQDLSSRIARFARSEKWINKLRVTGTAGISDDNKVLMLNEMERIMRACGGNEDTMWSYRGQCVLRGWSGYNADPTGWCIDTDFDESILAWHLATNLVLMANMEVPEAGMSLASRQLQDAFKLLSNYMMFLLVEHPYMLPHPVRARQYDTSYSWLLPPLARYGHISPGRDLVRRIVESVQEDGGSPAVLVRGVTLANMLLTNASEALDRVILGVWVEMLCYAASHCSRDSHARQLNCGAELITIVWVLQTTMFNYLNRDTDWFKRASAEFFPTTLTVTTT